VEAEFSEDEVEDEVAEPESEAVGAWVRGGLTICQFGSLSLGFKGKGAGS
jgi:hypothetical protein